MNATTVAVDLAKSVFQLAVADEHWRIVETQWNWCLTPITHVATTSRPSAPRASTTEWRPWPRMPASRCARSIAASRPPGCLTVWI